MQNDRVQKLLAEQEPLQENTARYDAIWQALRLYPMDHRGRSYASHPTLLGNIIAAYEKYPMTRYGMDSVFYWPRLWLLLEKEKKVEIDASWSLADGLLSLSSVAYVGGVCWGVAAIVHNLGWISLWDLGFPLSSPETSWFTSISLLGLGYWLYRASLGSHVRKGETFKSVFDLYRDQLQPLLKAGPDECGQWRRAWAYLQYLATESEHAKLPPQPTLITPNVPPQPQR